MDTKLFVQAILKIVGGLLLVAALLFIPAGSFSYAQGWLLIAILFIPMFAAGLAMMMVRPGLLRKRLNAKEEQQEQKIVIVLSALVFAAVFVTAGLNYRFGWAKLPMQVSCIAAAVFLAGYALYARVIQENEFLSRTIEVQEGQKVVDDGLYGIVRHPMYMSTLIMFLAMPLVLGSPISFAIMLAYIPIIVIRIKYEEEFLAEELEGYTEYMEKVKHRLVPHIW
jgi:protein-S-isoprenylcysteine O-methyltransferase Ste14